MERNPNIVSGEAPESDSGGEEFAASEPIHGQADSSSSNNLQGIIVAGEAPESDEDREEPGSVSSISSAASVSSESSLSTVKKRQRVRKGESKYSTLLHKKLRERNISLYKNVSEFGYNILSCASDDLNTANQQLLQSQVQLQEAAASLHNMQSHLSQFNSKLMAVTTVAFIPQICDQ